MNKSVNEEFLDNLFQSDPSKVLELCKEWNAYRFHFEESKKNTLLPKYMSVKEWVATIGYIPAGGIRHLIFANPSFNKKVVKRVGKKVLLDVQALELWISEQNNYNPQ